MDFFKQLFDLVDGVDLTIQVKRKNDKLTIGVMPNAIKDIQPLTVTGTPEELDKKFFDVVKPAMEETLGVISTIDSFKASLNKELEDAKEEDTDDKERAARKAKSIKGKSADKPAPKEKADVEDDKPEKEKPKNDKPLVQEEAKPTTASLF